MNMSFLNNEIDPAMDYVNSIVNGTDNVHNLDVNITSSPPPRPSFTSTAQTNHFDQQSYPMQMEAGVELEKRLERLDSMMCTTFDAIRQLSHQVYS